MPTSTFSIPAASFTVGADIFSVGVGMGTKQAQNGNGLPRKLTKIGVVGSTNAGDAGFDLYAGGKYLGSFMNTTGGANVVAKENQDLISTTEDIIPGNVTLVGIVNDAAAANPVQVTVVWEDAQPVAGGFRSDKLQVQGGGLGGGFRRGGYSGGSSYRPKPRRRSR